MLIIRDDDTSYWTSSKDLLRVYGNHLDKGGKLSLAVVPESYQLVSPGDRTKFYINEEKHFVYENGELVEFLKPFVKKNQIEIMLHGYDHSYCVLHNKEVLFLNQKTRDIIGPTRNIPFLPECIYKDLKTFTQELIIGRQVLEDTFHVKIKTFVPPSNSISSDVVQQIDRMGLNISGTILPSFNRKVDVYSLMGYIKKMLWKLNDNKHKYPYIMRYSNHKELVGHAYTPHTDYDKFNEEFLYCVRHNYNFTMATHYWELLENERLNTEFRRFQQLYNPKESCLLKDIM